MSAWNTLLFAGIMKIWCSILLTIIIGVSQSCGMVYLKSTERNLKRLPNKKTFYYSRRTLISCLTSTLWLILTTWSSKRSRSIKLFRCRESTYWLSLVLITLDFQLVLILERRWTLCLDLGLTMASNARRYTELPEKRSRCSLSTGSSLRTFWILIMQGWSLKLR